ncbi:esterase family protein [Actinocorallia sp. API 0066]|uniref:alpha/beta hydrolase n=1 Tax=Actinocorallia sp. API 0066 TaxID=2896846 RepID=UPI001E3CA89E|nr:alpha/beta hydrolase family protein [Actinocorallia sp. API 0066]MCD0451156.1 esterase family protein [Actinocorallia sp. API 0066]
MTRRAALGGVALSSMFTVLRPGAAHAAPSDTGAQVIAEEEVRARTLDLTIDTPSIPFMKPKVRLFLPRGWSKNAGRTWPVLYVYGGGGEGDYQGWDVMTDLKDWAAAWDVLVVMPEGGVAAGFTDWLRPRGGGVVNWETFHTTDVVQLVQRNYRGGTRRAVMGISSGGQGAVTYAARHKGLFKYVASFSGILHMTKPGIPTMMQLADLGSPTGASPEQKWGDPVKDRANWLTHDPYYLAPNLRGVGLYVSTGTTGRAGPLDASFADVLEQMGVAGAAQFQVVGGVGERLVGVTVKSFVARIRALGIPCRAHLYGDGMHNWAYWNREFHTAWPYLMKALGARKY